MTPPALRRRRIACALALGTAAAIVCLLAAAPPLLESRGHRGPAGFLRILFHPLCHQIPERSFWLSAAPAAVCARCSGIYGGFLAGCAATLLLALPRRGWAAAPSGPAPLILAALPSALEAMAEHSGLAPGSGVGRALAGCPLGLAVSFYALTALEELPAEVAGEFRRIMSPRERRHAKAC